MAIPDPVAALVTLLRADAGVAALAPVRVFGARLPATEVASMPRKAVVIRRAGAGASAGNRSRIRVSKPRCDVFAYGETPYEASRLDLACYEALKQMEAQNIGTCRIWDAVLINGPIDLTEEDTTWPIVFRTYLVAAAEVAVT